MKLTCKMVPIALMTFAATLLLPACAPLVIGGIAAGTAIVATDRRTTGAQLDDTTMELRVADELSSALPKDAHINVNSFERRVLLTGEVASEAVKAQASAVASRSKNVRMVNNELVVAAPSSFSARTDDNTLGARVRAAFVNTRDIAFNSVEIVTERRVIYLMGAVTQKEADVAAHVASRVPGVQQVVKLFDVASAAEVNNRGVGAAPASAPQSPAAVSAPITTAPATTTPVPAR